MPRPNSGAGHRVGAQKSEFLLHMLKNAERNDELKGVDIDSLVIEHIQGNKAPKMRHGTNSAQGGCTHTHTSSQTCHTAPTLTEKGRLFQTRNGVCTEQKDTPEETEETKTYDPGVYSA